MGGGWDGDMDGLKTYNIYLYAFLEAKGGEGGIWSGRTTVF